MIIPDFKLKQTQNHIQVYIRLPYIKVNSSEFYIQQKNFKFYLKPYLLSLKFTQPLKTLESPTKAIYYHQKFILECHLEKEIPGQHFLNLQLMTSVLNKKDKKKTNKVLVQVVGSSCKQKVIIEQNSEREGFGYGFGLNFMNELEDLQQQRYELFGFDPKSTAYCDRLVLSQAIINKKFSIESYLFDKYDNQEQVECILKNKQHYAYLEGLMNQSQQIFYKQAQKMKENNNHKEILLSSLFQQSIIKQIFSILFSYTYELISMNGEFGPQSSKTINNTSLILNSNYLYTETSYKQMLINCYRRCLTYSLYKHLNICQLAKQVLLKHFTINYIKLMLIDLTGMFERSQPRYLLNKLYINDYLMYVNEIKIEQDIKQCVCKLDEIEIEQHELMLRIKQFQQGSYQQQEGGDQQSLQQQQDNRLMGQYEKLIQQMQDLETLD